jgi:hypothetical protein
MIEILAVDRSREVWVPGMEGQGMGYRATFRLSSADASASGEGAPMAAVIAGERDENLVVGASLCVETAWASISDCRLTPPAAAPFLRTMANPLDLQVCGPAVEPFEAGQFVVEVGRLRFYLDEDDTGGCQPTRGQWVSFVVHGLSLWSYDT